MPKKTYFLLTSFLTQLIGKSCLEFTNDINLSQGWINQGRNLINCYEKGYTVPDTFKMRFIDILNAINHGIRGTFIPSQYILDSAESLLNTNNLSINDIKASDVYKFLSQPYFAIFTDGFGMGFTGNKDQAIEFYGNYYNIKNNLLCLKKDWVQPDLPSWYCGHDCSYRLLSKQSQPNSQDTSWDQDGPNLLKNNFESKFNKAGEGSENYCDRNSVFFPLIVGWAERNIANHPEAHADPKLFIKAPADISSAGKEDLYGHLVGSSTCPESQHYQGCRVCDQFIKDSTDYQLCQWGFNFNRPIAWKSNGGQMPNDKNETWAWTINREGSLLKWFDHYWAAIKGDYLCKKNGKCNFNDMKIPTPHFNASWLKSLWGKKGFEDNENAGGIANIMHCKTAGHKDSLEGWDCSRFQDETSEVYAPISQNEIDKLD
jgi:hypothetical protein